jgi:RHS repeat-associated protein
VNGQTKTYHYDGADLISETGAEYTFGPGIDEPLKRKSGQNEYYLSDALGSVIGLADGNGVIKTSYNYSPFGKKQTTGASSDNPFTFTGREDDGTGLYYYRARYYSPDQKRFISADPLGFGGGDSNFYAYVGNNPINFSDPTGESWESFAQGLVVGGASGLVSSFLITAALTASGVTIGPLIGAVLLLGGGAALIASINAIANEPCPDKRDYLLGALIGGFAGGGVGARLGGRIGAGLQGNVAKGGLNEARAARDALAAELAPLKGKAPATVTGGYNVKTGEVAARACGGGKCAEDHVLDALGGVKADVRFTEAVRPRTGAQVPVCPRCEGSFGRDPFPPGTLFKTDK